MALAVAVASPALAGGATRKAASNGGHPLGLKPSSPDPKLKIDTRGYKSSATLAASADVTAFMPPIGNQGQQSSCAAWSAGYYYKTWWERLKHEGDASWDVGDSQFDFSPSFMYNQINGGYDGGANFDDAFRLMQDSGEVDIAQFPYNQNDYTTQPDSVQTQAALQYRIPPASDAYGWFFMNNFSGGPFGNDIAPLKSLLASGKPLVFGIPVFDDFPDDYGNPKTSVYVSNYNQQNPVNWNTDFMGGHGVCIAGYDDNVDPSKTDPDERGGFLMLNSWGTGWNYGGRVWLSYKFVKDWVVEAWSMVDDRNSMPSIGGVMPTAAGQGDTMTITGDNFGARRRSARVAFPGGVTGNIASWTDTQIRVNVPSGAQSGQLQVVDWHGEPSNGKDVLIDASASGWFLAEGATWPGFDEYILLQNPNSTPSSVQVSFLTPQGRKGGPAVTVPALSRTTLRVNDYVANNDVSTQVNVTNGVNICAERAMYVNASDGKWGAHDSIGAKGSAAAWYLAEGATWPGYDEWVLVMNPNDVAVQVSSTFQTPQGQVAGPDLTLAPGSRQTIHVNQYVPSRDVSTKVECLTAGKGVVAERAMYVNAPGKRGCHESLGTSELSTGWGLAEGATWPGFEEWVLVQNPTDVPAQVVFYFVTPNGVKNGPTISLAPGARTSVRVNDFEQNADVSTMVFTKADNQLVSVERAMYMNTADGKRDAHNATASAYMSTWWYLPEGCTNPGYDEWVLVMNPDPKLTAHVDINFMTPKGPAPGVTGTLPPLTRATCHVNEFVKGEVSCEVKSDNYVVTERAMYISALDGKAGATDSLGVLASLVNPEASGAGVTKLPDAMIESLRSRLSAATPSIGQSSGFQPIH
jgi:IPT/TIG domain